MRFRHERPPSATSLAPTLLVGLSLYLTVVTISSTTRIARCSNLEPHTSEVRENVAAAEASTKVAKKECSIFDAEAAATLVSKLISEF